jgi:hypothetical protein
MMKIALFHNPAAARAMLKGSKLVRQFENAGYEVFYVSIKGQDWERAFREPFDRVIIAGEMEPSAALLLGWPDGTSHFASFR